MKAIGYSKPTWHTIQLASDGVGTFDLTSATNDTTIFDGGATGFIYVPAGSTLFEDYNNILVSEYKTGVISVYDIDSTTNNPKRYQ